MPGREETEAGSAIVYCVVPADLAAKLHETLRAHFAGDLGHEVVVERRGADRRVAPERRRAEGAGAPPVERRRIRAVDGRRVGPRRAPVVAVAAPQLPRRAQRHAHRLVFVERVVPSAQHLEDADTARVVTRFQAGDDTAFSELYMRYFDRVYSYLRVVLSDAHDAEDATQQAFLSVLEALPRYERRSQPFRAWLFVIVRNHALNRLRERRRPVTLLAPDALERENERAAEPDDLHALEWVTDRELLFLIQRLPLPQRQALVLRYMLDLSATQIAEVMDRSPDDVRMLQHRAQRFLRERLVALGRGPEAPRHARARGRLREATVLRARRFAIVR